MSKKLVAIVVVVIALIAGGVFGITRFLQDPGDSGEETQKRKISEPVNVIDVSERPYIQISPVADGRNVNIVVKELKIDATTFDYELEYQSGSLLQGAFGSFEIGDLPTTETILLGSCSAGGACTYHEDVKGGTLKSTFSGGDQNYAVKSDWKYVDNVSGENAVSSKDAKFQLEADGLERQRYIVVFNTAGYPDGLEGTLVSEIYSLATSSSLSGEGELTMRASEEGSLSILGWDGSEWVDFGGEVDGKSVTAEVELVELYVVVSN